MRDVNIGIERNPTPTDEKINWADEAIGVINDVEKHVDDIEVAQGLPITESSVYLNLKTFEGETYCIHLSSRGFHIVSRVYNTIDPENQQNAADSDVDMQQQGAAAVEEIYETLHAFLDKVSPRYVQSFGNQLSSQLRSIQEMRTTINEENKDAVKHQHDEAAGEGDTKKMRLGAN